MRSYVERYLEEQATIKAKSAIEDFEAERNGKKLPKEILEYVIRETKKDFISRYDDLFDHELAEEIANDNVGIAVREVLGNFLSDEDEAETNKFWEANKGNIILESGDAYDSDNSNEDVIWNNYKAASQMMQKGHPVATVVDGEDDNLVITPGYHYVNRVGYLVFKEEIKELPEEGVYY